MNRIQQPQLIEMRIVFDLTASQIVSVTGPLQNKPLSYGILEAARDKVFEYEAPTIALPDGQIPTNGQNGHGG